MSTGIVCLQGGRELTPPCEDMDRHVLDRAGPGPIAVLAGAARVGDDYGGASNRAAAYYSRLGAEVRIVPDPREQPDDALAALTDELALVVLPGGSPASLLSVLTDATTRIGERVAELHRTGLALSGSSAGAMVLCAQLFVPDGRPSGIRPGLGLAPGLALVHWSPSGGREWPTGDAEVVWGLPECGGVVLDGDQVVAVGQGEPSRRMSAGWERIGR